MTYSSSSEAAESVCDLIGWNFDVRPIKAYRRAGCTYATGTLLHPDEWRQLIGHHGETMPDGTTLVITQRPRL